MEIIMKTRQRGSTSIALVVILAMLALTGCAGAAQAQSTGTPIALPTVVQTQATQAPAPIQGQAGAVAAYQDTLENIYAQVNPSVVTIEVVESLSSGSSGAPGFPFSTPTPQQALGSGFVWDKNGDIVTNNHVVDGASQIEVVFSDGSRAAAKLVGADVYSDLAVIKVDPSVYPLKPVQLANSQDIKVGQLAVAIGNPFGNQETMTVGIISALGRSLPVSSTTSQGPSYQIPDVIQTDAPINPGNSGGVLLNAQGQVVGVTSALDSPVRANVGIGFAIPSNIVQKVVPSLIKNGSYQHSWLGISGGSLTPALAEAMNLNPEQRGALIEDVVSGGPADKANLQASQRQVTINGQNVRVGGDVIIGIDSHPIKTMEEMIAYLTENTQVGQTVTLTILRNGQEQTVDVTLQARPKSQNQSPQTASTTQGAYLGISGIAMSSAIAQAMNMPSGQQGILVERVEQGSPADQAGLQGSFHPLTIGNQIILVGGDVITAVDGQPVTQLPDLAAVLEQAQPGQELTMEVIRNGQSTQVSVTLGTLPIQTP
jgi:serine protease Do